VDGTCQLLAGDRDICPKSAPVRLAFSGDVPLRVGFAAQPSADG
jgi:hypothetical protein